MCNICAFIFSLCMSVSVQVVCSVAVACSWAVPTLSCHSMLNAIGCGSKPRTWCTLNSCSSFSATSSRCLEVCVWSTQLPSHQIYCFLSQSDFREFWVSSVSLRWLSSSLCEVWLGSEPDSSVRELLKGNLLLIMIAYISAYNVCCGSSRCKNVVSGWLLDSSLHNLNVFLDYHLLDHDLYTVCHLFLLSFAW